MALAKRYRRRIVVDEQEFFWSVAPDREWCYMAPVAEEGDHILTVFSSDKSFALYWSLEASRRYPDEGLRPVLRNKGDAVVTLSLKSPPPEQVTPGFVASLIRRALEVLRSDPIEPPRAGGPVSLDPARRSSL